MEKICEDIPRNVPNLNQYRGDLERACDAATQLVGQYDIGIGIAKKGLWLSYIFGKHELTIKDISVIRLESNRRFILPLDPLYASDLNGKRVLLMDNDVVTAKTINSVAKEITTRANSSCIDVLLAYSHTELEPSFYEEVRTNFRNQPII